MGFDQEIQCIEGRSNTACHVVYVRLAEVLYCDILTRKENAHLQVGVFFFCKPCYIRIFRGSIIRSGERISSS